MENNKKTIHYTGVNRFLKSEALQTFLDKRRDGTIKEFLEDWKWIFRFSLRHKGVVAFYTIAGLLSSTLSLGSSYVSRILINIITERQMDRLPLLLVLMVGTMVLSLLFGQVMNRIFARISVYVNNDIQGEIFDRIIDVKWSELNRFPKGDILNRFNDDVSTVSANAVNWLPNLIINIYTFCLTFFVLFRLDPVMAFIALGSAPFLLIMSRYMVKKQSQFRRDVQENKSGMMSFESETFYNFDTVKAFGVWGHYSAEFRRWQEKYKKTNLDYNAFGIKMNIAMWSVSTLVYLVAFGYCLYRLWTGQILYGDMTFFLTQRATLTTRFQNLVDTFPSMINSAVSAHRIRELAELPKEEHDETSFLSMREKAAGGLTLEMANVSFSYIEERTVYRNANFVACPNEIVALLGPSGGGKTTMFRLLLGLVEPEEGKVVLRDCDGNEIPMNADLRQLISYVPQGNTLFMGTVAENMRIVRENATDEQIVEALKLACAWDFVEPIGIYGELGERGRGLSEGQAQRISIARAMLRDAPILFLDEATSALDTATEARVLDNLTAHCPNKTVIFATHRTSVLDKCKRVYRIEDEKIIQE